MNSQSLEQVSAIRRGAIRRSILIVEDDEALAEILSLRLGRQGFHTTTATSGQLGLTLARAEKPHVILLDVQLPDMDGLELCQQLVDDERTCEIPVIIVSGSERGDIVRRSRAAGCHYFLGKPYDPNALLALIRQALEAAEE